MNITYPPAYTNTSMSIGKKIFQLILLGGCLIIASLIVWGLSYNRQISKQEVEKQISDQWGSTQRIIGPFIKNNIDSLPEIIPNSMTASANVTTEILHRDIFDVSVYMAKVNLKAIFDTDSIKDNKNITLSIDINPNQITELGNIKFKGKEYTWNRMKSSIQAIIPLDSIDSKRELSFETNLTIKGSEGLFIYPIGKSSNITINGSAADPSFQGGTLPDVRSLDEGNFSATWTTNRNLTTRARIANFLNEASIIEDIDSDMTGKVYETNNGFIGTIFMTGVDTYRKVNRSLKYGFILIFLTLAGVLSIELYTHRNFSIVYYLLIGVALVVFYVLLLSLSEIIGFGFGYLIASILTICLISAFIHISLNSTGITYLSACFLTLMYGICYVMLSLASYALLVGSLLIFCVLATIMMAYANYISSRNKNKS